LSIIHGFNNRFDPVGFLDLLGGSEFHCFSWVWGFPLADYYIYIP
jgi:hypothetical protein